MIEGKLIIFCLKANLDIKSTIQMALFIPVSWDEIHLQWVD